MRNVKRRLRVTQQAPRSFAVSRQRVYFPRGQGAQFLQVLHVVEKRQHFAELVHGVGRHAFSVVFRIEPSEALMDDVPYFHVKLTVACSLTLVKFAGGHPAVVLSVDQINKHALDVCVVAITSVERKSFSMRVLIKKGEANLNFDGWAKCDQVTSLEKSLLRYPAIGVVPAATFARIEEQVRICLGLV